MAPRLKHKGKLLSPRASCMWSACNAPCRRERTLHVRAQPFHSGHMLSTPTACNVAARQVLLALKNTYKNTCKLLQCGEISGPLQTKLCTSFFHMNIHTYIL